ncbi:uncharacterized protein PFL1_00516 [Pseudozyma flocculosa PF-1]|uniref:Related to RKM2 - ribosomal protein lysine methyltransferase n=1 Tax=Pseudozyma flocculosa TaxID=84751 RepID=A0A5C3EUL1_9BASI|nr:uncharacterized protein PFL1_00516 [Pseudozyma flocculosa PF-1]EPQ32320.1 hypothetical protein PFL1_00516 [Pseudozyma flocculosa PF-1]SPO34721.1 related to RKM2 - ribosomal protein lysine methyltransferase [Pseudozyma flocculosa]
MQPPIKDQAEAFNHVLFRLLSDVSTQGLTPEQVRQSVPLEVSEAVPAGRGLVFTEDIRPGQLLLSLPPRSLLHPNTLAPYLPRDLIPSKQQTCATNAGDSPPKLSTPQAISLVLQKWHIRKRVQAATPLSGSDDGPEASFLNHFAATLPRRFDTVPLFWLIYTRLPTSAEPDDGALSLGLGDAPNLIGRRLQFYEELLKALPRQSRRLLDRVVERFDRDFRRIEEVHHQDPSILALPDHLTKTTGHSIRLAEFLWAWLCVNSRCIFFPLGLQAHSDNFTLAPFLDMANHTSQPSLECRVQFNPAGGLELYAPPPSARPLHLGRKGMRKGDECLITYGAHSNASLLSEYGFVLPGVCPSDEEDARPREDEGAASDGATWKGNRYCEVSVDAEVERLFDEQGEAGQRKMELLQDRGYWGDYTLHPHPAPAHPSHRLVPALRLLALRLPKAAVASPVVTPALEGKHIDKTRRLDKERGAAAAKVSSHAPDRSKTGGKRQAKLLSYTPQTDAEGERLLANWEATLTGHEETVSPQNEADAHELLVTLCDRLARAYREHTEAIDEAERVLTKVLPATPILTLQDEDRPKLERDLQGCRTSLEFVRQLVEEELQITHLVRRQAEAQTEW